VVIYLESISELHLVIIIALLLFLMKNGLTGGIAPTPRRESYRIKFYCDCVISSFALYSECFMRVFFRLLYVHTLLVVTSTHTELGRQAVDGWLGVHCVLFSFLTHLRVCLTTIDLSALAAADCSHQQAKSVDGAMSYINFGPFATVAAHTPLQQHQLRQQATFCGYVDYY
jgi:hypothetical protein